MDFCPKCGMRIIIAFSTKKTPHLVWKCSACGYELRKKREPRKTAVKVTSPLPSKEPIVVISEKEKKLKTLPTTKAECPRCGNGKAYVWLVQTRGPDVSSTQFFRCTKCQETWREYS